MLPTVWRPHFGFAILWFRVSIAANQNERLG
jgi:hypothetical protein